jgi:hypothetical protein
MTGTYNARTRRANPTREADARTRRANPTREPDARTRRANPTREPDARTRRANLTREPDVSRPAAPFRAVRRYAWRMYGLVNGAIRDMVLHHHGADTWTRIRERAGMELDDFVPMSPYPDAITYGLVAAASEVLGVPSQEILEAFGEHWILHTAAEGYGGLLDRTGRDFVGFLRNLGGMHVRVMAMMPELEPPTIHVLSCEADHCLVSYDSQRESLEPFVRGLLRGLVRRFGLEVRVDDAPAETSRARFVVHRLAGPESAWTSSR